jgi:hypothetical protein
MTVAEVASILKLNEQTVHIVDRPRELPLHIGHRARIRPSPIERPSWDQLGVLSFERIS